MEKIITDPYTPLALVTFAWSLLFALARRWVIAIEARVKDNANKTARLNERNSKSLAAVKIQVERAVRDLLDNIHEDFFNQAKESFARIEKLERRLNEKIDSARRQAVTREELSLLVSNQNLKLEAIYERLLRNNKTDK